MLSFIVISDKISCDKIELKLLFHIMWFQNPRKNALNKTQSINSFCCCYCFAFNENVNKRVSCLFFVTLSSFEKHHRITTDDENKIVGGIPFCSTFFFINISSLFLI